MLLQLKTVAFITLSSCFMVGGSFATTNNRTLVLAQNDSREQFVPYFMKRAVTNEDLKSLTRHEIDIIRNEIYARHGYIFKKKEWDTYFTKQTWYFPKYEDKDFSDSFFTPVQKQNIEFIVSFAKNPSNAQAAANPQVIEGEKITGFITNLNNREPQFYLLRPVSSNDLQGLPKNDLDIMRNEIYARAGYIFQKKEWNDYFSAQNWYRPRFTSSNFKENFLSTVQKQNVEFIVSFTKTLTGAQPTAEVKPMTIPPVANIGDVLNQGLKIITGQPLTQERPVNNSTVAMQGGAVVTNQPQNNSVVAQAQPQLITNQQSSEKPSNPQIATDEYPYAKKISALDCSIFEIIKGQDTTRAIGVPDLEWGTPEYTALFKKIETCEFSYKNNRDWMWRLKRLSTIYSGRPDEPQAIDERRSKEKTAVKFAEYQRVQKQNLENEKPVNSASPLTVGKNYVKTVEAIPCGFISAIAPNSIADAPNSIIHNLTMIPKDEWGTPEIVALADRFKACNPRASSIHFDLMRFSDSYAARDINNKRLNIKRSAELAAYQKEVADKKAEAEKEAAIKREEERRIQAKRQAEIDLAKAEEEKEAAEKKAEHEKAMAPILAARAEAERKKEEIERPIREKARLEAEEKARLAKIESDERERLAKIEAEKNAQLAKLEEEKRVKEENARILKIAPSCAKTKESNEILNNIANTGGYPQKLLLLSQIISTGDKKESCKIAYDILNPLDKAIGIITKCGIELNGKKGQINGQEQELSDELLATAQTLNISVKQPVLQATRSLFCSW
jgi:hypothetical protein